MSEDARFENPSGDELRAIYASVETIAVVGASGDPEKPSHTVPEYLQSMGYRIAPVSPREGEVLGERVYTSLAEVDIPVDVVQVFRPPGEVPQIAREMLGRLVQNFCGCNPESCRRRPPRSAMI